MFNSKHPENLSQALINLGVDYIELNGILFENESIPTMAWAMKEDIVLYNREFVSTLTTEECMCVLRHEVLHKYGYIIPEAYEDNDNVSEDDKVRHMLLANLASDSEINYLIYISFPNDMKGLLDKIGVRQKEKDTEENKCGMGFVIDPRIKKEQVDPKYHSVYKLSHKMYPHRYPIYEELKKFKDDIQVVTVKQFMDSLKSEEEGFEKARAKKKEDGGDKDGEKGKDSGKNFDVVLDKTLRDINITKKTLSRKEREKIILNLQRQRVKKIMNEIVGSVKELPYYAPYVISPTRKTLEYIAMGIDMPIWENNRLRGKRKAGLFIDTSPSMDYVFEYMPSLIDAILTVDNIEFSGMWAFSSHVMSISTDEAKKNLEGYRGYGTDFNAVSEEIIKNNIQSFFIVTDGEGYINPQLERKVKLLNKELFIICTQKEKGGFSNVAKKTWHVEMR